MEMLGQPPNGGGDGQLISAEYMHQHPALLVYFNIRTLLLKMQKDFVSIGVSQFKPAVGMTSGVAGLTGGIHGYPPQIQLK